MIKQSSKVLVNIAIILAGLAVYGFVPGYGGAGQARMLIAIFVMVIAKTTVEFLLIRRQKRNDVSHEKDEHPVVNEQR